jgi:quinol monooxygenase YgiN
MEFSKTISENKKLKNKFIFFAIISLTFFTKALAQEALPGDACTAGQINRISVSGGPETTGALHMIRCNGSTWQQYMTVLTNGNVGIGGRTTPAERLDIAGQIRFDDNPSLGSQGCLRYNGALARVEYSNDCTNWLLFSPVTWSFGSNDDIHYDMGTNPRVGIGMTNPTYTLDVDGAIRAGTSLIINPTAGAPSPTYMSLGSLQGVVLTSPVVDDVLQYNGTNWVNVPEASISDMRMKYDVQPLAGSLQKILSLNGYSFRLHGRPFERIDYGVSAQEVQKTFPELVRTVNKEKGTLGVDYEGLIAPMIEAFKEQQAIIQKQQSQIQSLQSEVKSLQNKISPD